MSVHRGPPPPPRAPLAASSAPFGFAPPPSSAPPAIPEDTKRRIDHLVEFIQRNGPAFEETVRQRERDNPSFAFLHPGAPFSDYFQWRKRQACGPGAPPNPPPAGPRPVVPPPPVMPRGPAIHAPAPAAPVVLNGADPMSSLAVGAMANVCRLAKASGVPPYAPIPLEMVANVAALPPVEPGRLEIRLADFYRD